MPPPRPEAQARLRLRVRGRPTHRQLPSRRDSATRYAWPASGRRAPPWAICGTGHPCGPRRPLARRLPQWRPSPRGTRAGSCPPEAKSTTAAHGLADRPRARVRPAAAASQRTRISSRGFAAITPRPRQGLEVVHRRMSLVPRGGHRPPTQEADEPTGARIPPPANRDSRAAARGRKNCDLNSAKDRMKANQCAQVGRTLLARRRREPLAQPRPRYGSAPNRPPACHGGIGQDMRPAWQTGARNGGCPRSSVGKTPGGATLTGVCTPDTAEPATDWGEDIACWAA